MDALYTVRAAFASGRTGSPPSKQDQANVIKYLGSTDRYRTSGTPDAFYDSARVARMSVDAGTMGVDYLEKCAGAAGCRAPFDDYQRDRLDMALEDFRNNFIKKGAMPEVEAKHAFRDGWAEVASLWSTKSDPAAAAAQYIYFAKAADAAGYSLEPDLSDAAALPDMLDEAGTQYGREALYRFTDKALKLPEQPVKERSTAMDRLRMATAALGDFGGKPSGCDGPEF